MSDLLEAAEALLYVLGADHSQGEYQTAVDGLKVAVEDAGGQTVAPTAAPAPGHAPTLDEVSPADVDDVAPDGAPAQPATAAPAAGEIA